MKNKLLILILSLSFLMSHAAQAGGIHFGSRELSSIGSILIVTSPITLPIMSGKSMIDHSKRANEQEKQKTKKIPVKNKEGEEQILEIPEEVADQIKVQEGDIVELQTDEVGVLMIKNNQPSYYFVTQDHAYLFEHNKI
ncbi:STM0539 family protein [Neisseria sp. Ec49-e6-T10]|uniref:STM0539 family protein n=1 Tax=Neisseria sp. Ec49-e6-T10 TaxID=3140744 RepID=UPI003EBA3FCA